MPRDKSDNVAMLTLPSPMIRASKQNKVWRWIFNPGRSQHIANEKCLFSSFVAADGSVQIGNNETVRPYGGEKANDVTVFTGTRRLITLQDVISAPDIICDLVSALRALKTVFV